MKNMEARLEIVAGSCYKYKPVYLDEITKAVSALGRVTGKKNREIVSGVLGIFEEVEGRMENGDCCFGDCPIKDQCF